MKINFNTLPVGSLPYEDIQLCKQMMLRLFEKVPFLPELPLMDPNDNLLQRTIDNIPSFKFVDNKLIIDDRDYDKLMQFVMHIDKMLTSGSFDVKEYGFDTQFMFMHTKILKRLKPKTTIVNLMGPFTLANSIFNKNAASILLDKTYRQFIFDTVLVKALWSIHKVKEASPETVPLIMFDEKLLFKFGTLKRTNESITKETLTTLFSRLFAKVKKEGALVGVQAFEKCNWQLIFESGNVDIISFDAYNNPSNLNILAQSVNAYLAKGGLINWGIIPVMNENAIRSLNITTLQKRFESTIDALSKEGVSMDLLLRNSTVSVQGDLSKHPIIFAEKAIMMASQLGAKLPAKN